MRKFAWLVLFIVALLGTRPEVANAFAIPFQIICKDGHGTVEEPCTPGPSVRVDTLHFRQSETIVYDVHLELVTGTYPYTQPPASVRDRQLRVPRNPYGVLRPFLFKHVRHLVRVPAGVDECTSMVVFENSTELYQNKPLHQVFHIAVHWAKPGCTAEGYRDAERLIDIADIEVGLRAFFAAEGSFPYIPSPPLVGGSEAVCLSDIGFAAGCNGAYYLFPVPDGPGSEGFPYVNSGSDYQLRTTLEAGVPGFGFPGTYVFSYLAPPQLE